MIGEVREKPYAERILSFQSITVENVTVEKSRISGNIVVTTPERGRETFRLIFSYGENIQADLNLAGLILTMPVINFSYFSRELILKFPVSDNDRKLLSRFMETNSVEVFVNKICRRRYEFFKKEYIPSERDITPENARGVTKLTAPISSRDTPTIEDPGKRSLILSSGGKESLLTFGLMNETGFGAKAFFFNESGGHWKTAKTSHDTFVASGLDTSRVWSNVDRFYKFMTERIAMIDQDAAGKRADTYPVRLFIFPVYVFAAIPLVKKEGIGNILMGNEFDDPREMTAFHGIKHYYGIYDQSGDFMADMTKYLRSKGVPARIWSAVYPVSGIVVENALISRYHDLFTQQRSCHSCRSDHGRIIPCGRCTKCLGVMMFVEASGADPAEIMYDPALIMKLERNVSRAKMRLDPDELSYLRNRLWAYPMEDSSKHVTGIHILPGEKESFESVPDAFRNYLKDVLGQYCTGVFSLRGDRWALLPTQK